MQDLQKPIDHQQIKQNAATALMENDYQVAQALADRLFELKQYVDAIGIYQQIVERNPQFDYQIQGLGNNEEQIGYYQWDLYAWYKQEKASKRIKGSPYDALSLCCMAHSKYEEGIAWYKEMVQKYPKNYQIIFGYANILYNNRIYQGAINHYELTAKLKPKFIKPLVDLALLFEYKRINKRRSTQQARLVLLLDPNNQYALFILARNENDVDKKIQKLHVAWDLNIRYTRVCNEIGIAYGGTKKQYGQAIKWYTICTEINPKYSSCYNNIGVNNELLKKFQQAKIWYFRAVESDQQYKTAYKNLTDVFDQLKYTDQQILAQTKLYHVNQSIFCYYVGLSYYDKQKIEKSIKWIEKAIVLNPNDHRFYNSVAISYDEIKDYDKAIQNYKKCIESNPKYYSAYYNLAIVYKSLNQQDEAIKWYLKSTQINPRYSYAYNNLGNIYKKNEKFAQAIQYYEKAIEFNSTYTLAYINLGVCHLNLQQFKQASQVFQSAQEIVNTDNNNLSESNKEFIKPHLQKYELQGYKWRKFSSISHAAQEKLVQIVQYFQQTLKGNGNKLALDSSVYKSKELVAILRILLESNWELGCFGELLTNIYELYRIDKNLFYVIPWFLYQFFWKKKFIEKIQYDDIEIEIQNILSKEIQGRIVNLQIDKKLVGQQEFIESELAKLSTKSNNTDETSFNLFQETSYFTTCNHLFNQIQHVNRRALSHLDSFKQFVQTIKDKINKNSKSFVNLRIPNEGQHQFSAMLSILQEMFKSELGDGFKFQITAQINENLDQINYLQSKAVVQQLYKTWIHEITTIFLKQRVEKNQETNCYITDFVEGICLFDSVKEIIAAVSTIYEESNAFGFQVLLVKNKLLEKGQNNIEMIVKKKSSLYKIRLQLQQIHESVSFFREAKKIEISPFGSIFACLLACSKGKQYSLNAICQNVTDVFSGLQGETEVKLRDLAFGVNKILPTNVKQP